MTSPRSTYGGGYYSASFPDTPIYDSLVAERGTPQIAPIRVPAAYDTGSSNLPALPSALPALPAGPSQPPSYGYRSRRSSPLRCSRPPRRTSRSRPRAARLPRPQRRSSRARRPGTGYEAMRPAAPRPARAAQYQDPYNRRSSTAGY